MAELSESPSSNSWPTFFIEIIDGASFGLIDTARIWPTVSSCGTITLRTAMIAIQPRMIGSGQRADEPRDHSGAWQQRVWPAGRRRWARRGWVRHADFTKQKVWAFKPSDGPFVFDFVVDQ